MKKILLVLFFGLLISQLVFANITNYTIPSNISLNRNLTIYGISDGNSGTLCSFYIFDLKDQNQVLIRLTDNYTDSAGSFYAEWEIKEPLFRRGSDYNALTVCGSSQESKTFQVIQKEDIAFGITPEIIALNLKFFIDSNNSYSVVFLFVLILIVSGLGALIWQNILGK